MIYFDYIHLTLSLIYFFNLFSFIYVYVCVCVCVYICYVCGGAYSGRRRLSDSLDGYWGLNPGPLEDQQVFLTIESPLQSTWRVPLHIPCHFLRNNRPSPICLTHVLMGVGPSTEDHSL